MSAAKKSRKLSREERAAWLACYRDARNRANGKVAERSLHAIVRLASEDAWASLDEYRRAVRQVRP